MQQRQLGRAGLAVSRLGLGTWSWGAETDLDDAAAQLKSFLDCGGTLIDTADVYAYGQSESMLGRVLHGLPREDFIVATKAAGLPETSARPADASRRHLLAALDTSLRRLGVEYADLWQLHLWDELTPLEESMAALDAAVTSGRARYVGISNYRSWQAAAAATWQRAWPGRSPLASHQVEYSLLAREAEAEVLPSAAHAGLGVLCWSPLGRGVLTGKYRHGVPPGSRAGSVNRSGFVQPYLNDRCAGIVNAVATAADGLGVTPVAVALAWVRDRPGVVAPIVGARTAAQLADSLDADQLTLPQEIRAALDEVSAPR